MLIVGILEVGFGAEAEQDALALGGGWCAGTRRSASLSCQRVDGGQAALERLDALRVDLGLVHAGGPEVADDLLDAGGVRRRRRPARRAGCCTAVERSSSISNAPQLVRSPGIGVGGEPLAVDVAAEVGAGVLAGVEVADQEAVDAAAACSRRASASARRLRRARRDRAGGFFAGLARRKRGDDGQGQQQNLWFTAHGTLRDWARRGAHA